MNFFSLCILYLSNLILVYYFNQFSFVDFSAMSLVYEGRTPVMNFSFVLFLDIVLFLHCARGESPVMMKLLDLGF